MSTSGRPALFDDENYQDSLVRVLQWKTEALKQAASLLKAKDFAPIKGMRHGRARWITAERVLEYFNKHGKPVGKLLRAEVLRYATTLNLGERQVSELEDYLTHLDKTPLVPVEAVVPSMVQYKQEHRRAAVLEEMIELQATGQLTPEKWREVSEKVYAQTPGTEPVSAATLLSTDYPAPVFAVNSKLPTGLAMLAAKPKIGKTWMALQLGAAIARGEELFLGGKVKTPGPALYLALEDGDRRIKERLRLLAPNAEASEFEQLDVLHEWTGFAALRAAMAKREYKLIVIDPLLATAQERKTQDIVRADYSELQPLRKLAEEFKTTILIVHHLRKAGGESRDLIIGTTGITAAVDTLWILTNTPENDKVKCLKITGRDVRERSLKVELRFTPNQRGWRVVAEGPLAEAGGPLQRRILELLADAGPMFPKEIAETLKTDVNNIRVTLHSMRQGGRVGKEEGKYVYPGKRP